MNKKIIWDMLFLASLFCLEFTVGYKTFHVHLSSTFQEGLWLISFLLLFICTKNSQLRNLQTNKLSSLDSFRVRLVRFCSKLRSDSESRQEKDLDSATRAKTIVFLSYFSLTLSPSLSLSLTNKKLKKKN